MLCTREACFEYAYEPGAENGLGEFAGRMGWVPKACAPRVPTETYSNAPIAHRDIRRSC